MSTLLLHVISQRRATSPFGLCVCKTNPVLRASPDGVVSCKCCGTGVIEIKCPYSSTTNSLTGESLSRWGSIVLFFGNDNKVHLKKSSQWYTQVQTHLGVKEYPWCDFVLFSRREPCLTIEKITLTKVNLIKI